MFEHSHKASLPAQYLSLLAVDTRPSGSGTAGSSTAGSGSSSGSATAALMDAAGDPKTDARTLFVRNVAYDVDAAQLEEVFTDIGPVRQCFLVTDKQQAATAAAGPLTTKRHKGIAFVQFAIPEDAERALEELNGKEVAGRRLKVRGFARARWGKERRGEGSGAVCLGLLPQCADMHVCRSSLFAKGTCGALQQASGCPCSPLLLPLGGGGCPCHHPDLKHMCCCCCCTTRVIFLD